MQSSHEYPIYKDNDLFIVLSPEKVPSYLAVYFMGRRLSPHRDYWTESKHGCAATVHFANHIKEEYFVGGEDRDQIIVDWD